MLISLESAPNPFRHNVWGRLLAALAAMLLFATPVYMAYLLSSWSQPWMDRTIIAWIQSVSEALPYGLNVLISGDYGVVTLGIYSFIWAFPVVVLLGGSLAAAEESGLKDAITDSLERWMSIIGLNGRDLIPVLSGFGCNVVAVFQSRACSACTRKSCVSLIAFGSACSYQIGASLSIFGSAGRPWLFFPYLLLLVIVGAIHTRLWAPKGGVPPHPVRRTHFDLQVPQWSAMMRRVWAVIKQFLQQAMPIFIMMCLAAGVLQLSGTMDELSKLAEPLFAVIHIPVEAASSIMFSILRKDGILLLNANDGAILTSVSAGQLLVIVYLASTLTACMVTLWTIGKELGWRLAAVITGRQMLTSLVSATCIMLLVGR
ncbi:ferrous iron transporter B [Paenibacillus sp. F411]|uniref:ferrous iron transporter B n=1 Tax=Paenibacillus sp. F411 TaxID=2820239 RepID=UPI001AAE9CA1|nr:ferrous iron transporter B [Paenibacillus sp. F411]MBO2946111.1 ferrous iron transporter B [Paenibacillus sp. F411]